MKICTACGEVLGTESTCRFTTTFPSMNRTYWALILRGPNRLGYTVVLGYDTPEQPRRGRPNSWTFDEVYM